MGLFNYLRCKYPLPDPEAQNLVFQTKSMDPLLLDQYEVTEDGRLLHQAYESRGEKNPKAPLGFYLHRENLRWQPVNFQGELEIHDVLEDPVHGQCWCSYVLWFKDGRVTDLQHGPGHGERLPDSPQILT